MTEQNVTTSPAGEQDPEEAWWAASVRRVRAMSNSRRLGLLAGALVAVATLAILQTSGGKTPDGFARSNGRVEAERIDIASKYGGRLSEVLVKEGEAVITGQILARVDTAELETQLHEAEANLQQNDRQLDQANALLAQRKLELTLSEKQYERTETLKRSGHSTDEQVDLRLAAKLSAAAAESAAQAQVSQARSGVEAGAARVARIKTMLEDSNIKAPRQGRIQHRVALPGQVLPPSGRILTALDPAEVYMTVFLPLQEAGRLAINSEARLIFDSAPGVVVPASVSFVADEAQFTPKYVETKTEREKLMFRVKVQIARDLLERHAGLVKVGTPGVVYVKLDNDAAWPRWLDPALPEPSLSGGSRAASEPRPPEPVQEKAPSSCGVELAQESNILRKGPRLDFTPRQDVAQREDVSRRQGPAEQQSLLFTSALISVEK